MQDEKKIKISIREMSIDDIAPAFHLGEKLFTLSRVPNLYRIWDEYEITELFNNSDFCFSALVNKVFAGFLLGTIVEKTRKKYGYLIWLGVDQEHKRLGIASSLFREFKKKMKENGVKTLLVDTQADNKPAIDFFYQKGFNSPEMHIYLSLDME
jgi:ribosomal protein S18 acetylase RimI-like enzyme